MENQSLEDKIRSELFNLKDTPDAGTWEKLSEKLDSHDPGRRPFVIWALVAAGILSVVIFSIRELSVNGSTENSGTSLSRSDSLEVTRPLDSSMQTEVVVPREGKMNVISERTNPTRTKNTWPEGHEPATDSTDSDKKIDPTNKEGLDSEINVSEGYEKRQDKLALAQKFSRKSGDLKHDPVLNELTGNSAVGENPQIRSGENGQDNSPIDLEELSAEVSPTAADVTLPMDTNSNQNSETPIGMGISTSDKDSGKRSVSSADSLARERSVVLRSAEKNDGAEDDGTDNAGKRGFRTIGFTLMLGPSLQFNSFQPYASDEYYVNDLKDISSFSTDRLGHRSSLMADWTVSPKWRVYFGATYHRREYTVAFQTVRYNTSDMQFFGDSDLILITPIEEKEKLGYQEHQKEVSLTINAAYRLGCLIRGTHYIGAGLNIGQHRSTVSFAETQRSSSRNGISYNVFYNLERPINQRWHLNIQPMFTSQTGRKDDQVMPVFKSKSYDFSLLFGLGYKFR